MGSMSLKFQTATIGWQYDDKNHFCTMKNSSINLANSIGSQNNPVPNVPSESITTIQTSNTDSCPQSYHETETNEERTFREFIASRLPEYKASPLLLEKIRNSIQKERLKSAKKLRSTQNK
jgi:hypothetical protein